VRAYATSSAGTGYGGVYQITTLVATPNVTDIDGNVYHTITIGTQVWMVENLKTTKYNDGTAIPLVTDNTAWSTLSTPAYCWYNNDATTYKNMYGALYNWYAVNTAKLAPTGWHVPTDTEWTKLENYVSTNLGTSGSVAEALAATTNWATIGGDGIGNNLSKNNSTGFSALPGGYRYDNVTFSDVGYEGYWWSSSESNTSHAWSRSMNYYNSDVYRYSVYLKTGGFSVRCLRD
jgi:uncharacterized protein (TIGR02145 family)